MPLKKKSLSNANLGFANTNLFDERQVSQALLRAQLLDRLVTLPFAALMGCVRDLLAAEGYTNVRLSGRVGYRGRNKEGGYDLEAFLPSPLDTDAQTGGGVLRRRVLVQVKQFEPGTRVYQRTLDALRGACLRTGAIESVLITTSDFSSVVRNAEANLRRHGGDAVAPVHLLNGSALVDRLIRHEIGVQGSAGGTDTLDSAYFDTLQRVDKGEAEMPSEGQASELLPKGAQVSLSHNRLTLTLPLTLFTRP